MIQLVSENYFRLCNLKMSGGHSLVKDSVRPMRDFDRNLRSPANVNPIGCVAILLQDLQA